MEPTIGRIVHYTTGQAVEYPAMVARVWGGGTVNLWVFPSGTMDEKEPYLLTSVRFEGALENPPSDGTHTVSTWHWPER